ncbi:DUF2185 domain-containing protein [Neisseria sp. Dent CA1/247]|uniref:Protein of uncharacterized function (DUF2185) n=1 Tax=Neisseria zoodegmatis TaxID=326523 RepID=A0A378WHD0_9NEIS|nr:MULTISPECIES: DUF2185 domain-containing protein [Neisseria]UOO75822.1 DUF2185 domain-containing protein [Neisseria sp. Dent CA1/247]SUA36001.1 Protein of uncharacterised function (DUF2185) [Neisseria zoodegmatis]
MNIFANALSTALGRCIAAKTVSEEGRPVGFMYREEPVFEQDSGWRFFSGDETDEYTANPDNFGVYSISDITRSNPAVAEWLNQPAGSAWETDENGAFQSVEDWQPKD